MKTPYNSSSAPASPVGLFAVVMRLESIIALSLALGPSVLVSGQSTANANQASGSLVVTVEVRTAILLTVTSPSGTQSGGGLSQAAVVTNLTPRASGNVGLTTRAITSSNPDLSGYRLLARLATSINGKAAIDGIALSQQDVLISDQLPYGQDQTHALQVSFASESDASPLSVVLTAKPR